MDKVITWRDIQSGVEPAPDGYMTSNSEVRDFFGRQYSFGAMVEDCRQI